jgi:beta-phosphoglucomutase-like phosphatase (HAD superfamily)
VSARYAAWNRVFVKHGYRFGPGIHREKVDGPGRIGAARAARQDVPLGLHDEAADFRNRYQQELIDAGQSGALDSSVRFVRQCQGWGLRLATGRPGEMGPTMPPLTLPPRTGPMVSSM